MVSVLKRMTKLRTLLHVKLGSGAVVLPPEVKKLQLDFAYKIDNGHRGARRFWREQLIRLKYHNPAVPMAVNRTRDNSTISYLRVYWGKKDHQHTNSSSTDNADRLTAAADSAAASTTITAPSSPSDPLPEASEPPATDGSPPATHAASPSQSPPPSSPVTATTAATEAVAADTLTPPSPPSSSSLSSSSPPAPPSPLSPPQEAEKPTAPLPPSSQPPPTTNGASDGDLATAAAAPAAPAAALDEQHHVTSIPISFKQPEEILAELLRVTNAQPVLPTVEEEEQLAWLAAKREVARRHSLRSQELNEARRQEAMRLAVARGENIKLPKKLRKQQQQQQQQQGAALPAAPAAAAPISATVSAIPPASVAASSPTAA